MWTRCPGCGATFVALQPVDENPCPACAHWFIPVEHQPDDRPQRRPRRQRLSEAEQDKLQEIRGLVTQALLANGLDDWQFGWVWHREFMGRCIHFEGGDGFIEMSVPYCLDYPVNEAVQTALHECAHALCPKGHRNGHDEIWQAKAAALGVKQLICCDRPPS